jgi:hypothetical protein
VEVGRETTRYEEEVWKKLTRYIPTYLLINVLSIK